LGISYIWDFSHYLDRAGRAGQRKESQICKTWEGGKLKQIKKLRAGKCTCREATEIRSFKYVKNMRTPERS